ncbi:hypothetical protein ACLB2K_004833 [Fragaria x ananassa]
MEDMLRSCAMQFRWSWDNNLSLIEFAYNNSFHSSIGMAPFEALYGQHCRTPLCWNEGVVCFGKRGKLSPRYIGPYEIIERVGTVAYRLELPSELSRIHNVFHESMLRKYIADPSHVLQEQPISLKKDLTYEEEPVQILDRKEQVLRNKTIPLVKVLLRSQQIEEATWEPEEQMRQQYHYLFE